MAWYHGPQCAVGFGIASTDRQRRGVIALRDRVGTTTGMVTKEMGHFAATFAMAGVSVLVAGCGGGNQAGTNSTTTVTSLIPRPVVERELDAFLLSPAQINPLMGATDMAVIRKHDAMSDDSATMRPGEC